MNLAAVAELADNHLDYAGDRSDFVNLISLISACDYDDSNSFADLLTAFARIVSLTVVGFKQFISLPRKKLANPMSPRKINGMTSRRISSINWL